MLSNLRLRSGNTHWSSCYFNAGCIPFFLEFLGIWIFVLILCIDLLPDEPRLDFLG